MGLKVEGAKLCLNGGLLNRTNYISVHTGDPGNNNANEFPHTGANAHGYARIAAALAQWTFPASGHADRGIAANSAALNFPTPTGNLGDPTHCGLSSGINADAAGDASLFTGALAADVAAPLLGAQFGWPAGDFTISVEGGTLTDEGSDACLRAGLLTATRYLSLHTADPGTTGANEVAGGTYAREAVALAEWTIAGGTGIAALNVEKSYGVQTTDLPDLMWVALRTTLAAAGGVLWKVAFSNNPDDPEIGDTLSFAANQVTIGLVTDA